MYILYICIYYIYIYDILAWRIRMKKLNRICQILAVMLLLALSHRVVLFRCLQHMNEIYKICVSICLHKSDVIKLTSFSAKKLLGVFRVTLV